MSDDYNLEEAKEQEVKEGKEDVVEEDEEELPSLSLQDIELLMRNTEVWDELISGKISVDEAKKLFSENYSKLSLVQRKKVSAASKKKKVSKAKKPKKKKEESENEEEAEE